MIVWNDVHNYLLWATINKCFMFECLKFMSCVGPVSIDCLSIDQQCHIMISCKHDAMLSLSLFLDQSTWGITLVKRQGNPPTSITWSPSQVDHFYPLSTFYVLQRCWCCLLLLLSRSNYRANNPQPNVKRKSNVTHNSLSTVFTYVCSIITT